MGLCRCYEYFLKILSYQCLSSSGGISAQMVNLKKAQLQVLLHSKFDLSNFNQYNLLAADHVSAKGVPLRAANPL